MIPQKFLTGYARQTGQNTVRNATECPTATYKLAVLDNDQFALTYLKDYLSTHNTPFELTFHSFDGMSALDRLIDHPKEPLPDCILLAQPFDDFHVPFICNRLRLASAKTPILGMVMKMSEYHTCELKRNGAQGVVEKTTPQQVLAVLHKMLTHERQAQDGFRTCQEAHIDLETRMHPTSLPPRVEEFILKMVCNHRTATQVAKEMGITATTGRKYTMLLRKAMGTQSTEQAIQEWINENTELVEEDHEGTKTEQPTQAR
ncbi:hypothetical protein [Pseudoscardovia suis]|uniref:hypothetical protein n=1 Tax=Pseudoscardovia suis TaxID=987063 RepID=UPI003F9A690E